MLLTLASAGIQLRATFFQNSLPIALRFLALTLERVCLAFGWTLDAFEMVMESLQLTMAQYVMYRMRNYTVSNSTLDLACTIITLQIMRNRLEFQWHW